MNPSAKVVSLHPGVVRSDIFRSYSKKLLAVVYLLYPLFWFFTKNTEQGAQTTLYAAMSEDVKSGGFYMDCKEAEPAEAAKDPINRKRVWERSEEMLGINFNVY